MTPVAFAHTSIMFLSVVLVGLLLSQATTSAQATTADADLLESAKLGELARARELLSKGAAVNTSDRRGFTPLMWASASGNAGTGATAPRKRRGRGPAGERRHHRPDAGLGKRVHGSRSRVASSRSGRDRRQGRRHGASARARARAFRGRHAARASRSSRYAGCCRPRPRVTTRSSGNCSRWVRRSM